MYKILTHKNFLDANNHLDSVNLNPFGNFNASTSPLLAKLVKRKELTCHCDSDERHKFG